MIERGAEVAVTRQAQLLGLSRSSVYYTPRPLSQRDLRLMRRIDELHLELPFYGSRKLADRLRREGHEVGRRHVATLMRRMGIEALYRRPRTSIPARGAAIYPYLLSGLRDRTREPRLGERYHVFADAHGFMYLVAILDIASRKVLSFRLSNTAHGGLLHRGARGGDVQVRPTRDLQHRPGLAFTSDEWIKVLKDADVAISMDGKGRWIDNVFIERLWRASNTRRSICTLTRTARGAHGTDPVLSAFTTQSVRISPSSTRRRTRCTSAHSRPRRRWRL